MKSFRIRYVHPDSESLFSLNFSLESGKDLEEEDDQVDAPAEGHLIVAVLAEHELKLLRHRVRNPRHGHVAGRHATYEGEERPQN